MPLKQPPLRDDEIRDITLWVKEGAKFDGGSESETAIASLVDPLAGLPRVALKVPVSDPVTSLAFSPDGRRLASAIGDDVVLWDPLTGRRVDALLGHAGPISVVRISADGRTLVAAGGRPGMFGSVAIWNLETKTKKFEIRGHADSILDAAFSPDGQILATASHDRLVALGSARARKSAR